MLWHEKKVQQEHTRRKKVQVRIKDGFLEDEQLPREGRNEEKLCSGGGKKSLSSEGTVYGETKLVPRF